MATTPPPRATTLFGSFLLLLLFPPSQSLSFSQLRDLLSLSHSLTLRVANLRASRGDHSGAARARLIASKLEEGLGLGFLRVAWDYLKNYAWSDLGYRDVYGAGADLNKLVRWLGELTRAESDAERVAWVGRNYPGVLMVSKSLFVRILKVFRRQGPLREMVQLVRKEVIEGGLLRDCLEMGTKDLNGLFQILKDMATRSSSSSTSSSSFKDEGFREI